MNSKDSKKEIHLSQGTIIKGRYQIVDLIGRGGFCYTYKAFDSVLNVYVAIKEYFPHGVASRQYGNTVTVFTKSDETMFYKGMKRFLNEARSLAQFNTNPSVVSIYDFFEENNTAYLIMEYLEGEDMKKHVGPVGNVLDFGYVKWLADYLCDTLGQIHAAGIVHRDISPDNIFICKDGNIKLIDFGAVKQSVNKNNESVTVILKQGYAPIEQYSSKGKLGPWTDIYALGATIYRLITGRIPPESVDRMVNDLLVPAHMLNPAVPKNFSFALMKAMALKVEDRYHSMQEFKAGLNDQNVYPEEYYNQVLGQAYRIQPAESWETKALIEESSIVQNNGFEDISQGYEEPVNVNSGYGNAVSGVLGPESQVMYDQPAAENSRNNPEGQKWETRPLIEESMVLPDGGARNASGVLKSGVQEAGPLSGEYSKSYESYSSVYSKSYNPVGPGENATYENDNKKLIIALIGIGSVLLAMIGILVAVMLIPKKSAAGGTAGTGATTETVAAVTTEAATQASVKTEAATEAVTEVETEAATEVAPDEGDVLNIYCWNDEFKRRLTDHYPGYEEVDATHGKIGDVDVVWNITPSADNAYQNNLDAKLPEQDSAAADNKIDIFLLEADYALKYIETDYAMPIADLGITDGDIANQYKYTQDIVTDSNGVLKGLSWQGCPGVLIYNREIAKDVLGTDEPDTVQAAVKDWATYKETAAKMKEKGYVMTATANDTYRVFSDNVSSPWVVDGRVHIDSRMNEWVDMSKEMVDAGETGTEDLWGDAWSKGFYPEGKTFCYFGPAWLIDFCMAVDDEASIAHAGGWGATTGPEGFSWGGTWIVAATGTDNPSLVADIMRKLTIDTDIMIEIVKEDNDFVNNKPAMETMAQDSSYGDYVLGGQNPLEMFCDGAEKIDRSNMGPYDQGCTEEFQKAMKNYFDGNATKDEAIAAFKAAIVERYPELTVE